MTEAPQANVSSISSQNYESINADLDLSQDSVGIEFLEESNSDSDSEEGIQFLDLGECEIIDEIDFRELEQIPHAMVKESKLKGFMSEEEIECEGKLEGFMSEAEIDFQDIDRCEEVELLDEQCIEEDTEKMCNRVHRRTNTRRVYVRKIELQGIDKCKMVERDMDRETVDPPEMSVRIAYEQEECIEEKNFDMSF